MCICEFVYVCVYMSVLCIYVGVYVYELLCLYVCVT